MLLSLGFTVHVPKSVLVPTQKLCFVGFVINSVLMTVSLTEEKTTGIIDLCSKLLSYETTKIRFLTKVIGCLVATFPAVLHGPLHYRGLEFCKIKALKISNGNFDAPVQLSDHAQKDLHWWIDILPRVSKPVNMPQVDLVIFSDASLEGWGGTANSVNTGGRWSDEEGPEHMNALELYAAYLNLLSFVKDTYVDIRLMLYSTSAISYINKMGGTHYKVCNSVAIDIWNWAIERGIWLSAAYISSSKNETADCKSRNFHDNTEWSLDNTIFNQIYSFFGYPNIDLFASSLNYKVEKYCSWKPDPTAFAVDAFTLNWADCKPFIFPPFSIIGRVIAQIIKDKCTEIVVVPYWATHPWFPAALQLITEPPLIIPPSKSLLQLPGTSQTHPLSKRLSLLALHLSGKPSHTFLYQLKQKKSLLPHGGQEHKNNMEPLSEDMNGFVLNRTFIPFHLL